MRSTQDGHNHISLARQAGSRRLKYNACRNRSELNTKDNTISSLNLYSVFHCNLSYSSIHEDDHKRVIHDCYWPLLEVHEKYRVPFSIEMTGSTLLRIAEIDRTWVAKLKQIIEAGLSELQASGYAQIIGPLVPQRVNEKNLETGLNIYEEGLGLRPKIAYVNEQAFSSGLADVYIDAGFEAIIMEWNNVYSANKNFWNPEWQYYPQYAISATGREIPVIWNNAVSFQRLQRYIHGEISSGDYISYLKTHTSEKTRSLCMYGNDLEIINFRPGRYHAEAELEDHNEWRRYEKLIGTLNKSDHYSFVLPGDTLSSRESTGFNKLQLSTPAQPVPVKKQAKYNITRWALTGRDDVRNNGACYGLYEMLERLTTRDDCCHKEIQECWKELCSLWGSDFRTHITDEKYSSFIKRQGILEYRLKKMNKSGSERPVSSCERKLRRVRTDGEAHYVAVETPSVMLTVNSRRGMSIDSLVFREAGEIPLVGTLRQGYFNDISWGVDLYSGHVIVQPLSSSKVTDLEKVRVTEMVTQGNGFGSEGVTSLSSAVKTSLGSICKSIHVFPDRPKIELEYEFEWNGLKDSSLHAGIFTFNPEAFDEDSLYYATNNGGPEEKYYLKGHEFDHSHPVMHSMITATHCLGATEGIVRIGDKDKALTIKTHRHPLAAQPMIQFYSVDDSFLLRLLYSLGEQDETSHWMWKGKSKWQVSIEFDRN